MSLYSLDLWLEDWFYMILYIVLQSQLEWVLSTLASK
jgi:hypothetical protein